MVCTYKVLKQTHHSRSFSNLEDHKLQCLPLCQVETWKSGWVWIVLEYKAPDWIYIKLLQGLRTEEKRICSAHYTLSSRE